MTRRVLALALAVTTALAGAASAAAGPAGKGPVTSPSVVVGADGWLFSSQDWRVPCQDSGRRTRDTTQAVLDVGEALAASGRQVVTLFGPDKSSVLPEELPARLPDYWCHARQDREQWDAVTASSSFLDLRAPLRQASRSGLVFYRGDTHFSHAGDAVYTRELARALDPSLPLTLGRTRTTGHVRGDLASLTRRPSHEQVTSTTSVRNAVQVTELPARDIGLTIPVRTFRATPLPGGRVLPGRTVLVGDSYTAVALPQLAQLSQETVFVWTDSAAPLAPMLEEIAAGDRVVLESVERLTTRFRMWRPDVVQGLRTLPPRTALPDLAPAGLPGAGTALRR